MNNPYKVSDEEWAIIKSFIPVHVNTHPRGGGRPRVDDRKVFDAILFVSRTGCQWNALNATGICSSSTAHLRFQEWTEAGVFQELWKAGLLLYDEKIGIGWKWQSMDGAMMKSPLGGKKTGKNPTDRGKLGVKRSILTDQHGLPIGLAIDGANRHDVKLVRATLESVPIPRPKVIPYHRQHLCLDAGYVGDEVKELAAEFEYTLHVRSRGDEARDIKRKTGEKARRWVVERTHSWLVFSPDGKRKRTIIWQCFISPVPLLLSARYSTKSYILFLG
jgi:putative transposase